MDSMSPGALQWTARNVAPAGSESIRWRYPVSTSSLANPGVIRKRSKSGSAPASSAATTGS